MLPSIFSLSLSKSDLFHYTIQKEKYKRRKTRRRIDKNSNSLSLSPSLPPPPPPSHSRSLFLSPHDRETIYLPSIFFMPVTRVCKIWVEYITRCKKWHHVPKHFMNFMLLIILQSRLARSQSTSDYPGIFAPPTKLAACSIVARSTRAREAIDIISAGCSILARV